MLLKVRDARVDGLYEARFADLGRPTGPGPFGPCRSAFTRRRNHFRRLAACPAGVMVKAAGAHVGGQLVYVR